MEWMTPSELIPDPDWFISWIGPSAAERGLRVAPVSASILERKTSTASKVRDYWRGVWLVGPGGTYKNWEYFLSWLVLCWSLRLWWIIYSLKSNRVSSSIFMSNNEQSNRLGSVFHPHDSILSNAGAGIKKRAILSHLGLWFYSPFCNYSLFLATIKYPLWHWCFTLFILQLLIRLSFSNFLCPLPVIE